MFVLRKRQDSSLSLNLFALVVQTLVALLTGLGCSDDAQPQDAAAQEDGGELEDLGGDAEIGDAYGESWEADGGVVIVDSSTPLCSPLTVANLKVSEGSNSENAVDGDLETHWSAKGVGQWIRFELNAVEVVSGLALSWFEGDTRRYAFRIEVSLDGEKFREVFRGWSESGEAGLSTYGFEDVPAKFIRVVFQGNTATAWVALKEAEVRAHGCEKTPDRTPVDPFGIRYLYATNSSEDWDSRHWKSGSSRTLTSPGQRDPNDPTGWSRFQGSGSMYVNPQTGYMRLRGDQPRMYVNALSSHKWINTETTVYYQRKNDSNVAYAGGIIGARSGPDGHGRSNCTATTYYSMLRHDGAFQYAKELMHPNSAKKTMLKNAWDGKPIPKLKWIGLKYIVYTLNGSTILETYRDLTGGKDGGDWKLLGRYVDSGNWEATESCSFPSNHVVTEGGGIVFIRNTKVEDALYKWVSVRELARQ